MSLPRLPRIVVGAKAAVDQVIAPAALDDVGEIVAGQALAGIGQAGEVLDIGEASKAEGGERGADLVECPGRRAR